MNFKRALSNHEAPKSTQTAPIRQARDERLALWLAHERFARARRSRLLFGRALGGEVLRVEPPAFLALGRGLAPVAGARVPIHLGIMPKWAGDEALEVADFIVHAAGRQARRWDTGDERFRRDFEAVFHANALWSSFNAIASVH
jgi:hypothetical protein